MTIINTPLVLLAQQCGGTFHTPGPTRAIRGMCFTFEQLEALAERLRQSTAVGAVGEPVSPKKPLPHVSRHRSGIGTPDGAAQEIAKAFLQDGLTVLVVTHDGKAAPPGARACGPEDLEHSLGLTLLDEMDSDRQEKVVVVIDAQPIFHEGRVFHPIKPETVTNMINSMLSEYPNDDLAVIYVQE